MTGTSTTYSYPFNVKVQKHPCIFYDALIRSKIEQFIANNIPGQGYPARVRGRPNRRNDYYEYYKDVYDDKYGELPPQDLSQSDISDFFDDKTKFDPNYAFSITSPVDCTSGNCENFISVRFKQALTAYINEKNRNSLFVIPILIDDENYTESNQQRISRIFSPGSKFIKPPLTGRQGNAYPIYYFDRNQNYDNVYLLPCLLKKGSNMTEDEYVKFLKAELLRLQEHIQKRFNQKRQRQTEEIELFTDIVFFYNPDGKISLRFYTDAELRKISKEGEDFLNKHLFKELKNVRGKRDEGKPQLDIDERLYSHPIFRKNQTVTIRTDNITKKKSKFLEFLYKKIFELEILISNFNFIGSSQFFGIRKFKIVYSYKLSVDFNDFKPGEMREYVFTQTNSEGTMYKDLDKLKFKLNYETLDDIDKSQGYFKIKDIESASGKQTSRNIPEWLVTTDHYLKFLPSDLLKFVVIYTRPKNLFIEKMRGILQLSKNSETFDIVAPSQLSRKVDGQKFYYYENLDFTMNNFKRFVEKQEKKKVSKDELRDLLIKTFTNRTLLKEYFTFCTEDKKGKKDINFNFYNLADAKKEKEWRSRVVQNLTKEFTKKGSKFWVKKKRSTKENKNNDIPKKGKDNYNKYLVKNIKKGPFVGTNSEIRDKLPKKAKRTLGRDESSGQEEYALVYINLKPDDKDNLNANNDNTEDYEEAGEFVELVTTPTSDKCNKRRKTLKKRFSNLAKNIKGKAMYHALAIGSKLKNVTRRRNRRNPAR